MKDGVGVKCSIELDFVFNCSINWATLGTQSGYAYYAQCALHMYLYMAIAKAAFRMRVICANGLLLASPVEDG